MHSILDRSDSCHTIIIFEKIRKKKNVSGLTHHVLNKTNYIRKIKKLTTLLVKKKKN